MTAESTSRHKNVFDLGLGDDLDLAFDLNVERNVGLDPVSNIDLVSTVT